MDTSSFKIISHTTKISFILSFCSFYFYTSWHLFYIAFLILLYLPENVNELVSDFHDLMIRIIKEEEDDYQHKDGPVPEDAVARGL